MGVNGNFCAISIANSQAIMQKNKLEIMLYRHSYNYLTYGCLFFYIHDHNRLHFGNFSQNICLTCILRINYDNILSSYTNEEDLS